MVYVKSSALPALLFAVTSLAAPVVDPQTPDPNNANANNIPNPNVYSNDPNAFLSGPASLYPGAGYIPYQTLTQPAPIPPQNAPQIYPQGISDLDVGVDNLLGPYGYGGFNSFGYGAYAPYGLYNGLGGYFNGLGYGEFPQYAETFNTDVVDPVGTDYTQGTGINTFAPSNTFDADPITADNSRIAEVAVDPIPADTADPVNANPADTVNADPANTVNADPAEIDNIERRSFGGFGGGFGGGNRNTNANINNNRIERFRGFGGFNKEKRSFECGIGSDNDNFNINQNINNNQNLNEDLFSGGFPFGGIGGFNKEKRGFGNNDNTNINQNINSNQNSNLGVGSFASPFGFGSSSGFTGSFTEFGGLDNVGCGEFNNVGCGELNNVGCGEFDNVGCGELNNVGCGEFGNFGCGEFDNFNGGENNNENSNVNINDNANGNFVGFDTFGGFRKDKREA
ncbi:hypothetical protein RUND412_009191 [Rhizina undulata]